MAGTKRSLPQSVRQEEEEEPPQSSSLRKQKKTKKNNNVRGNNTNNKGGLRHFSMLVCKKVEEKGITTYNEVADELVREFASSQKEEEEEEEEAMKLSEDDPEKEWEEGTMKKRNKRSNMSTSTTATKKKKKKKTYDDKNIRRRVYDALNVLMAMDVLIKEKKEIRWKGLPTMTASSCNLDSLHCEYARRQSQVMEKRQALQRALSHSISLRNLVRRNRDQQPSRSDDAKIALPFVIINTQQDNITRCEMTSDSSEVMFQFDSSIQVREDYQILQSKSL